MTTTMTTTISQSLFDETLLENEEAFDLSPSEALKETIDQFLSQLGVSSENGGSSSSNDALSHLVLLHPSTEEGRTARQARNEFQKCLNVLDGCVNSDGSVDVADKIEDVSRALWQIQSRLRGEEDEIFPYLYIIQTTSSIYTFMSFLGVFNPEDERDAPKNKVLLEILRTLIALLSKNGNEKCNAIKVELKDLFVSAMGRIAILSGGYLKLLQSNVAEQAAVEITLWHLLQLATVATKNCESAKVAYVQSSGAVKILASTLHLSNKNIIEAACQLLSTLCRYDDFRENSGPMGAAANTSSAHDHAMEFHRAGVEERLIQVAKETLLELDNEEGNSSKLMVAVLTALRVLAVNDDIIQTMVALGVLPVVTKALELGCKETNEEATSNDNSPMQIQSTTGLRLASASLGLLRNLCGNDEIKTNLCLGSSDPSSKFSTPSALPHILHAMSLYPTNATLQEHACGTLAAMALRRPANAQFIISKNGPKYILNAMKRHDENASVQRQGALAVRNLVSRLLRDCPDEGEAGKEERNAIRDTFLDLGAEGILRNVAGRHQGSVDEAYAALRDLGCKVSLLKLNGDGSEGQGQVQVQKTMMFGEKHNTNFRPVYEDSVGLESGVEEAISQFGL